MKKTKTCSRCNTTKFLSEYTRDKQKSDGYRPECKSCKSERDKIYRNNNKKKIKKIQKKYYDKNSKKIKKRSKDWYHNNQERGKASRKKWYTDNKDRHYKKGREWIEKNSESYKEYQRKYQGNRYRKNINCRIKTCLNKRLRDYVTNKNLPTMEYIDIPMEEFKCWIEYQFEDGMSWDNMGKKGWSFDHVIPCDSFDLSKEEEIFQCYNWTNLRPCWCPENSSKGNKIIPKLIKQHDKKLEEFIEHRYCF